MSRLIAEHPGEEETIVRNERLLGQLIPLRAFGDVRFKWSADGKVGYVDDFSSIERVVRCYRPPNILRYHHIFTFFPYLSPIQTSRPT